MPAVPTASVAKLWPALSNFVVDRGSAKERLNNYLMHSFYKKYGLAEK
jgi:hypothetical protein